MAVKEIKFGSDARAKMLKGVEILALFKCLKSFHGGISCISNDVVL